MECDRREMQGNRVRPRPSVGDVNRRTAGGQRKLASPGVVV